MQQGLRASDVCLLEEDLEKPKFDMRLHTEQLRHRTTIDVGKSCRTSEERSGKISSLKDSPDPKDDKSRKGEYFISTFLGVLFDLLRSIDGILV